MTVVLRSPLERLLVWILLLIMLVSGTVLLYRMNKSTLVAIPHNGGIYREGIVGIPRFINPLLAATDADRDLVSVIYAGLLTHDPTGALVPELAAQPCAVSEDGTMYTCLLKEGLTFHDGTPLTADDIVFTVTQAANASLHNTVFADWDGVTVAAQDERTVVFTLPHAYAPFIENMTIGILPKHLWSTLPQEEFSFSAMNNAPIGAGPYRVDEIVRDATGVPVEYRLSAFDAYGLGKSHISRLIFHMFRNAADAEEAYVQRTIDALSGIDPENVPALTEDTTSHTTLQRIPMLRIFGVFFNHNQQPIFLRDEVRAALDRTAPRDTIVETVLGGYGTPLTTPVPPYALPLSTTSSAVPRTVADEVLPEVQEDLASAGWMHGTSTNTYELATKSGVQPFAFSLATAHTDELARVAEQLATTWRSLGASVTVNLFDPIDLTQSVIRPRKYDALLFGEVLGHGMDLYAFWHSSQRNDPGLNVAQYADIESDSLLELARTTSDPAARAALIAHLNERIAAHHAAVFLYAPDLLYVTRDTLHTPPLHPLADPSERFDSIHEWYLETDLVWPFVKTLLVR